VSAEVVADELGLEVVGLLPGGEHQVWAVCDGAGAERVLKVFALAERARLDLAIDTAVRVRARGVPVPDPYVVGTVAGCAYTLQARCSGAVPEWLEDAHARQLLDAWESHRDAVAEGSDWPERAVAALCRGDRELFADHGPVRAAGGSAAALLDEIVEVGESADPSTLRSTDAMHGDWHHRNLLVDGERVTAIIDWENARPGDGRLDLVLLGYWTSVYAGIGVAPRAEARVRAAADRQVEPVARALLSAFIALHQLWFVCAFRPERRTETVDQVRRHLAHHWSNGA
jgi:aminoglycoside phosphotransferase (APT) family kinase protein